MPRRAALSIALSALASCCPASSPPVGNAAGVGSAQPEPVASGALEVRPDDVRDRPFLLDQLVASPFAYFRFVGIDAAEGVCRHFREDLPAMPVVNLHGDAHLEQFSVTREGRGLADFDDASTGPAVIDLSRFAASVRLAATLRGWEAQSDDILGAFFRGYREALVRPDIQPTEPAFARRIRAETSRTPAEFLSWCDSIMHPLGAAEQVEFDAGIDRFRSMMGEVRPDLATSFFDAKQSGALHFGIGSALDKKLLMRIEGPSSSLEDDIVLEIKEVRDMRRISCVHAGVGAGAFRVLLGQSRIGRLPQAVLGYVPRGPKESKSSRPLWVQSWSHDYRELAVKDLDTAEELTDVAYDVGVQLGLGHTQQIAAPLDVQLRYAQRAMIDAYKGEIAAFAWVQANDIHDAWTKFHAAATAKETRP